MKTRIASHHLAARPVRERAYTAQLALLRREMILQRAKGRWAHIEHDAFPLGTGIRLPDGVRQGSRFAKTPITSLRLSCLRSPTFPCLSTPCTCNTAFARSIPIVVILIVTLPLSSGWLAPPLWHLDAG
jgi:hypothetical protein